MSHNKMKKMILAVGLIIIFIGPLIILLSGEIHFDLD